LDYSLALTAIGFDISLLERDCNVGLPNMSFETFD